VGSRPLNIQDIRVAEGIDKTIVEVEGEGLMLFTTFRLTSPDRLVLEISEVGLGKYQDEINMSEGPIRSIVPVPSGDSHVSRLEFLLSGTARTDVRPEGLNIVVEVTQLEGKGGERTASRQEKPAGNSFRFFQDEALKKKRETGASDVVTKTPSTGTPDMTMPLQGGGSALIDTLPPPLVPPVSAKLPKPTLKKESRPPLKPLVKPAPKPKEPIKPLAAATKVMALQFIEGKDLKVLISMNGQSTANVFFSDGTKKHIVIDLPGVMKNMQERRMPGDGRIVRQVRTGIHPEKLRLVIDLLLPVQYTVVQNRDKVELTLKENP